MNTSVNKTPTFNYFQTNYEYKKRKKKKIYIYIYIYIYIFARLPAWYHVITSKHLIYSTCIIYTLILIYSICSAQFWCLPYITTSICFSDIVNLLSSSPGTALHLHESYETLVTIQSSQTCRSKLNCRGCINKCIFISHLLLNTTIG